MAVESVGKDERRWLFANSWSLHPLSFVSPMPNLPSVPAQYWCASGPTLAFPIALNYKYILHEGLCYDAIELLTELFDFLVFVV